MKDFVNRFGKLGLLIAALDLAVGIAVGIKLAEKLL